MDDWLLNWLHHHHRFGLLNYYDRLLMDHRHWGYHKETTPILSHYGPKHTNVVAMVNANQAAAKVWEEIESKL